MNYDVFISCKSEDYPYAESIYDFLRQNGINTFLASKELRILGDSEYRKAISMALASTYHMIVFASKAEYINADWVFYEWDWFITAKLKRKKPGSIITILKDIDVDTINPDLWKYESFPFNSYQERILSYVETPSSKERKKAEEERFKIQQKISNLVGDYRLQDARLNVLKNEIVNICQALGRTTKECPVCSNSVSLSDTWCDRCGYFFHPLYSLGGEKEVGPDSAYLSHFRTIWKSQQVLIEQQRVSVDLTGVVSELEKRIAFLETEIHTKDIRLASAENDQGHYKKEIARKEETIRKLESELVLLKAASPAKQTEYDVILVSVGPAKLQVIMAVKENAGLGLKEAKDLVDMAPVAVKKKVSKTEAMALKSSIEKAGAKVVIEVHSNKATQTNYDVILVSVGPAKLQVIMAVRENAGLGLKEAKDLVDMAPVAVKKKVSKAKAEALKTALEEVGAEVVIQ